MKKKKKTETSLIREPEIKYNRVNIFYSFEEERKFEINEILEQSPKERIEHTVTLILRVYGLTREILNDRKSNNKIIIKKL